MLLHLAPFVISLGCALIILGLPADCIHSSEGAWGLLILDERCGWRVEHSARLKHIANTTPPRGAQRQPALHDLFARYP
eukprot:6213897-Pleurochrysis_carterae.AAC.1